MNKINNLIDFHCVIYNKKLNGRFYLMTQLHYQHGQLFIEQISLEKLAGQYGTPCYLYSKAAIEANWHLFAQALQPIKHRICYAVKANSNINILRVLQKLGAHFDIVSQGELMRVLKAGGGAHEIVFSGVGKSQAELDLALQLNIFCIDIESEAELNKLKKTAAKFKKKISVALRINPNINPITHAYISTGLKENKFGIELSKVIELCQKIKNDPYLNLIGLACHIGSQITDLAPFALALDCLIDIYYQLKKLNIPIDYLNIGGGLGITYQDKAPSIKDYAAILEKKLYSLPITLLLEPGRAIVGNTGCLLTRIEYIKETSDKKFAIVDAGMNDLLRPALYQAWQPILPVIERSIEKKCYDIAGPVCESADFLGKNRELSILEGDLLAIDLAGAYGFSMTSNYNSRPRAAEILIDKTTSQLIRKRETIEELFAAEIL
jgi:diaminopimelate decarboxylase